MNLIVSNAERIEGTGSPDFICAGPGDNLIVGKGGDDIIYAGDGDDIVRAQGGDDTVHAQAGDDIVHGGKGDDVLSGNSGWDLITGGDGDDQLRGQAGLDRLVGGEGKDVLRGGADIDVLHGGLGRDLLFGAKGDDRLSGNAGNDYLDGGEGTDRLNGGRGWDICLAGEDWRNCEDIPSPWIELPGLGDHPLVRLSGDGRFAVIKSRRDNTDHLDRVDLATGEVVSVAVDEQPDASDLGQLSASLHLGSFAISDDGNLVAFASSSVHPGQTIRRSDVFLRDISASRTIRVNPASASNLGIKSWAMSADGKWISYFGSSGLPDPDQPESGNVFFYNVDSGETSVESAEFAGPVAVAAVAGEGRYLFFNVSLEDGHYQLFRLDRATGEVITVGVEPEPIGVNLITLRSVSTDGRYALFLQAGFKVGFTHVRDLVEDTTTEVTGNGFSVWNAVMSGDGRVVAYSAQTGENYIYDPETAESTSLPAIDLNGVDHGNIHSLSHDGSTIAVTTHTAAEGSRVFVLQLP